MGDEPKTVQARLARGPRQVGPYLATEVLGVGGFGTVYRAKAPAGPDVALKVMVAGAVGEDFVARFKREAAIRIDHPNVVKVLDAGEAGEGEPYIAFELIEGETLHEKLRHAPLPAAEVVEWALQICAGVGAAHERGIVHRDLKPGNVMFDQAGGVKLLDFGVARGTDATAQQLTVEGAVVGTPGYFAPEQARGERHVDARADVWAVGVILYQALSAHQPFLRDSQVATMLAVVLEEPEPLSRRVGGLPDALVRLVHRCLAKDASARYPDAKALALALRAIDLGSAPSSAVGERSSVNASLPVDERRVVALLLADGVKEPELVRRAIEDLGGNVVPIRGGRVIGVFGGQTWEGDEARRAIIAAAAARRGTAFIAVASGHATGAGGTVSGDVVRAVERACAAELPGIAVDAVAARELADVPMEQVGKGLFEIPAGKEVRLTVKVDIRGDVALLGRSAEVAQLRAAVTTSLEEQRPVVVWVGGPPGIGKTRLRSTFEEAVRTQPNAPRILVGRGEPHRRDAMLHVIGSLLRSAAFPDREAAPAQKRAALLSFCEEALGKDQRALDCAIQLANLVDLPPDTVIPLERPSDPQLVSDRLRVSLLDVLLGLADRPLALVVDDAQWADDESLTFLEELCERVATRPVLLFLAARPELHDRHPALLGAQDVVRINPRGLIPAQVRTLAESIAGKSLRDELTSAIAERTDGNPFFVEQIVRELAELELLESPVASLPIPLHVEGAVQSRLDHLPFEEKQLCKRAAVLTRGFTADALVALGVSSPGPLLAQLARRGLIAARAGRSDEAKEYSFRSALFAEVAYRMNTEHAATELHRRAAQHLSSLGDVDPADLAWHYERGGLPDDAALCYTHAALRAARRGDTKGVLAASDKAIGLGAPAAMQYDLHMVRADALSFLGRRDEQAAELTLALQHADTTVRRARALSEQVGVHAALGNHDVGRRVAADAVAAARETLQPDVIAIALARQTWILLYSGSVDEAARAIAEAEKLAVGTETAALVAAWRAQIATARGAASERRRAYEEAIHRFRSAGDLRRAAAAECNLADTFNRLGAYDEAEAALRDAIESCRKVSNRVMEGFALANLGYALTMKGRTDEALAVLDAADKIAKQVGQTRLRIALRVYRARAMLPSHPPDEVVREAETAADEARRGGLPALGVAALSMAAQAWLRAGDPAMALALSRRAIDQRNEIGAMEEDEIEVFLTHARCLIAVGRTAEAQPVLQRGLSRLNELAAHIDDDGLRGRFLRDVAANRDLLALMPG